MSRVGRRPIAVPEKVKLSVSGRILRVEGPLGTLSAILPEGVDVAVESGVARVSAPEATRANRGYQGLVRALLANMVEGVVRGYQRSLEITGVGYKAELKGTKLTFSLGYTRPVEVELPPGIKASVQQNVVTISGSDKQLVGEIAARIRSLKPPEPYKGKGVKYSDEKVRRKVGKTGAK